MKHLIRVGVVRGGPSNEYDISLQTGGEVLSALREHFPEKYKVHDVLIDKQGAWHVDGLPVMAHELHTRFDVIFNALHGEYGEDGTVQQLFETHGIPFTGSGSLSSAIGMNKHLSKQAFAANDIKTVIGKVISSDQINQDVTSVARELFNTFPMPAVVKPLAAGSSVGVSIVHTKVELEKALTHAARYGAQVLIEEYIKGTEVTVGVIEGFRDQELYVLPVVEIRPKTAFFDYAAKYGGQSEEIVPAPLAHDIKEQLSTLAKKAHRALGLRHYSRSDFIIHPRRGIYIIETNTLPGLTRESLIPKALRAVGGELYQLVDHLIGLSLRK